MPARAARGLRDGHWRGALPLVVAGGIATLALAALVPAINAGASDPRLRRLERRMRRRGAVDDRGGDRVVTALRGPAGSLATGAVLGAWQLRRRTPEATRNAVEVLASTAGAVAAKRAMQALVERHAASGSLASEEARSRSSRGRVAASSALALAAARLGASRLARGGRLGWLEASAAVAATAAIDSAALYRDEHSLTDVLAGTAIGVATAALVGTAVERWASATDRS